MEEWFKKTSEEVNKEMMLGREVEIIYPLAFGNVVLLKDVLKVLREASLCRAKEKLV